MKILNTIATIIMLGTIFILYTVFFHNKHVHPIGKLSKEIDEKMRCSKLIPLFKEYEDEHEDASFIDRHITAAGETVGRFDAVYTLTMRDTGMFGNPVLTVFCDKNMRVLKYTLEAQ